VVDNGLGLVVGSQIAVSGSKTSISNGTTNTVGDSVLATGGRVDVESNRSAIAYEVLNSLGAGSTLTSQILVEARGYPDNDVRIGTKVSNTIDDITLTSFSGWSFGASELSPRITFPDNTTQTTAFTGIPANIAYTNQDTIFEKNVTIQGNLTALGTSTFKNTVFSTTSALSVVNLGPGPALYVYQAAGASDVASFYDGDGIEVLDVGNAQGGGNPLGKVGINESFPGAELTVNGAISSNRTITALGGNSNQWNSNWTTTNGNSAAWSNWQSVSANYALGSQYVKLSGDTMTGALSAPALSADTVTAGLYYGVPYGGSIDMRGGTLGSGGSINTSGGADGPGGSIDTHNNGGAISTNDSGGYINTSSGGYIDT